MIEYVCLDLYGLRCYFSDGFKEWNFVGTSYWNKHFLRVKNVCFPWLQNKASMFYWLYIQYIGFTHTFKTALFMIVF